MRIARLHLLGFWIALICLFCRAEGAWLRCYKGSFCAFLNRTSSANGRIDHYLVNKIRDELFDIVALYDIVGENGETILLWRAWLLYGHYARTNEHDKRTTHPSFHTWILHFNGRSLENYIVTPLNQPLPKFFTSCVDPALPTVVYTFGYRGRCNGPATKAVLSAHIKKKKRNVILLDWEEEAKSGVLGIPLGYAIYALPNAKKIGKEMGEALMRLHKAGMSMESVHLIGHSLGAHIMGFAGKRTREIGRVMPRITGLDPARALFEGTLAVTSGLDRTCARFVDIIHSDPGGYGTSKSTGTVDIWPNYGSETPQPGCPSGDYDTFTVEDLCSHDRAWRYYVEAISLPTAFPASAATDYDSWVASNGAVKSSIYLGDLTNTKAQGNFYLTTNPKPEYGKGLEGMKATKRQPSNVTTTSLTKLLITLR